MIHVMDCEGEHLSVGLIKRAAILALDHGLCVRTLVASRHQLTILFVELRPAQGVAGHLEELTLLRDLVIETVCGPIIVAKNSGLPNTRACFLERDQRGGVMLVNLAP